MNELDNLANKIKNKSKLEIIKSAYEYVSTNYRSGRFKTYIYFNQFFINDIEYITHRKNKFVNCTLQNKLIKYILIKTGKFSSKDIKTAWGAAYYISPHQWLKVKLGKKWIEVDPWSKHYGVPFGKNGNGFAPKI